MKLKYIADQKYDALMIYQILSSKNGIVDLKYQAENMNLDIDLVKKISEAENYENVQGEIEKILFYGFHSITFSRQCPNYNPGKWIIWRASSGFVKILMKF